MSSIKTHGLSKEAINQKSNQKAKVTVTEMGSSSADIEGTVQWATIKCTEMGFMRENKDLALKNAGKFDISCDVKELNF